MYKRGAIWWARFTINGVKYRQSLDTNDRREALDKEKVLIGQACEGKLALPGIPFGRLNFGEAIDQYIADRKPRVAQKTFQTEIERGKIVKAKLGSLPLKKVRAEIVLAYLRTRKGAGLSNGTINRELDVIRGVLKRAKLWAAMSDDVRPFPIRHNVGRVLDYEEKLRLIRWAKERPEWQSMRLAMTLALNTTMRKSEVRLLRWRDIDLFEKSIEIRLSKTEAGERVIPLNQDAFAAILELRERAKILFGEAIEPNWYLFPLNTDQNAKGPADPLRPVGSWRRAWRSVTRSIRCRECSMLQKPGKTCWQCGADISRFKSPTEGFRFHDLRHQAITELRENGADDATVMGIAGHVSRKMLEHYSHARLVLKRAAVERLGRAGQGTVGAQSDQFRLEMDSQVVENVGGRDRDRTGDLLVAKTETNLSQSEPELDLTSMKRIV
jgi:integrase